MPTGYELQCPKCQQPVCTKVIVVVPVGQDPRRVLVESLAGLSPLPQRIISSCPHCGWTNEQAGDPMLTKSLGQMIDRLVRDEWGARQSCPGVPCSGV